MNHNKFIEKINVNYFKKYLSFKLNKYQTKKIKLNYPENIIKQLFFNKVGDHYYVSEFFKKYKYKIDFCNVSFDDVYITHMDFSGMTGVKINPQKIYKKELVSTLLNGVEFISDDNETDLFKDVLIFQTDFTGSKNAKINPQTIAGKILIRTICNGVEFIGPTTLNKQDLFEGAIIIQTNFSGSKNAKINPQTVANKDLYRTICKDVAFIGENEDLFKGCQLEYTNFEGSSNAVINPQTVFDKSLRGAILKGVTFVCDDLDNMLKNVTVVGTDFSGSIGAIINPQKVRYQSLFKTNLKDAKIIGFLDDVDIYDSKFENCNNAIKDKSFIGEKVIKKLKVYNL